MPLSPDSVGKWIMFSGWSSTAFVHLDRSCYHDILWTAWAISVKLHLPLMMIWLDFGGLEVKGQGHCMPLRWQRHPRWRWIVQVLHLVINWRQLLVVKNGGCTESWQQLFSVDCVRLHITLCVLCSFTASDKAAGWNVTSHFQAAASSCPADGTTVIHQVKCSEYCRWNTHPAYHHVSASHSINVISRLRSQRADKSDCWSGWCHDDADCCCFTTSHIHKDVVIDNHYDSHSHKYVVCFTQCWVCCITCDVLNLNKYLLIIFL